MTSSALTHPSQPLPSRRDRTSRAARAVEQCQAAWSDAYAKAIENTLPETKALRMAAVAYKLEIPKMDNLASTKCAFACIAHGISLEVFSGAEGSQLLYAAQVASTLYNRKGAKK
jgi:hypothetical protein